MRLNLPNLLTLARLALLPLVLVLIWPGNENRETAFWATMAYIFAGILDLVDGALARRTNQVTAIGMFLDPLADKVFYLVTLVALLQLPGPWVPPWIVMVVLVRELAVTGLRGIASAQGIVIAAGDSGKIKTTFATVGMCGLLIHYPYLIHTGLGGVVLDIYQLGLAFTYISVLFSIYSAVEYVYGFVRALGNQPLQS